MKKHEMGHRSDEITSYLSDALEPEARASFEAHLAGCKECQEELAAQKALFAQVNQALAFKPKRSIDEQVARFEREVAAERAATRAPGVQELRAKRPMKPAWWVPLGGLAIAASVAAVVLWLRQPSGGEVPGMMAAPHRPMPALDGGVDGGVDGGMDGGLVEKR